MLHCIILCWHKNAITLTCFKSESNGLGILPNLQAAWSLMAWDTGMIRKTVSGKSACFAKFYYIVSVSHFAAMIFKPCHIRPASSQCFNSAQKSCRSMKCALCSRQQHCVNVVKTLCNRLERHAAAFILNMLKTNSAAGRLHSMLDRARCEDAVGSSRASWAHRVHAWRRHVNSVLDSAFGMHFDFVRTLCTRYNWQIWYFKAYFVATRQPADRFSERCTNTVASPFGVTGLLMKPRKS